jgi:hypothetical protein
MPTKYESASILVLVLASQGESKTSLWIYPHEMRIGKDMCPVIYIFLKIITAVKVPRSIIVLAKGLICVLRIITLGSHWRRES